MDTIHYLYKENCFSQSELDLIFDELNFLNNPLILEGPEVTGSAEKNGSFKKKNKGVWVSDFYTNPHKTSLCRLTRKVLDNYILDYSQLHYSNRAVLNTNYSKTLLSYYENADCYEPHTDSASVTVLFWFFKEPKHFDGGDLILNDIGKTFEVQNNSMLMFPSWAKHSVTEVKMDEKYLNQKLGRYSITMFMHIHPHYDYISNK
jgi:Rps23 Pro-64 3,4-dihydroxylase Tpa1-like proline 4-hydroxylase